MIGVQVGEEYVFDCWSIDAAFAHSLQYPSAGVEQEFVAWHLNQRRHTLAVLRDFRSTRAQKMHRNLCLYMDRKTSQNHYQNQRRH